MKNIRWIMTRVLILNVILGLLCPAPLVFGASLTDRGRARVSAAERGNPWVNMLDGESVPTRHVGTSQAAQGLQMGTARPLSLASADLNADGAPDLIAGYTDITGGGILAIYPGNPETFYSIEWDAMPFAAEAQTLDLPLGPDWLGGGRQRGLRCLC